MQTAFTSAAKTRESAEPSKFTTRIGSTVYTVSVQFSSTATETIEDKILRMMESEVRETA